MITLCPNCTFTMYNVQCTIDYCILYCGPSGAKGQTLTLHSGGVKGDPGELITSVVPMYPNQITKIMYGYE